MADYEKEKKKIKKKTKKLGLFSAGPSPIRIGAIAMENRRRKKQRQKELAALPMKVDDFKFDHELRKTKQSVGMKDPQTKTMKFDKVKKKSAGGSMQSYIDRAKKELGDFKSTGSKSTLSKSKSKTFRDEDEGYKPKRKKVSMGKITTMKSGGKTTQKKLDKAAKYRASVAYQTKNAPKSKGMDYLKDPSGTLSKDMAQVKKIRRQASNVAAGDPIAEKKYGTGKRTGTNLDKYLEPRTDGSVEFRSKTTKFTKKKADGGSLKSVPADNKGLGKLPQPVRNKMGYMKKGGVVKMRGGGAATRGMNFNRGY